MKMKKLLIILLSFLSTGILIAQDMKLDELLEKYYKAIGQDKSVKIQTFKITGKMSQRGGVVFQLISFNKRPDMERVEFDLQGTKLIVVFDGQTGWMINPLGESFEPQDMSADQINSGKKLYGTQKIPFGWNNPLVNWKENGDKIELVGKEDINGMPAYNIKMTFSDNEVVNYYMDIEKNLILNSKEKSMIQGQIIDVETIYSDFRNVDSVLIPFKLETLYNGRSAAIITFDKVEINLPLDDAIFKKPAVNTN